MRKLIFLLLLLTLFGCNQNNEIDETSPNFEEQGTSEQNNTNPDYQNVFIEEVKETSIVIVPPATDPDASYPAYEIFVDEHTKIEGNKEKFDELAKNDDVKVWVKQKGSEKEIATKIVVLD
ncbi:hypothetical protein VBD025_15800 [Virgibacillus flavescens]|uniref:hypothetical protein n=1 Tax=Virgibacillus flavescens TaxID=1611422 RepID=UPI003D32B8BB